MFKFIPFHCVKESLNNAIKDLIFFSVGGWLKIWAFSFLSSFMVWALKSCKVLCFCLVNFLDLALPIVSFTYVYTTPSIRAYTTLLIRASPQGRYEIFNKTYFARESISVTLKTQWSQEIEKCETVWHRETWNVINKALQQRFTHVTRTLQWRYAFLSGIHFENGMRFGRWRCKKSVRSKFPRKGNIWIGSRMKKERQQSLFTKQVTNVQRTFRFSLNDDWK